MPSADHVLGWYAIVFVVVVVAVILASLFGCGDPIEPTEGPHNKAIVIPLLSSGLIPCWNNDGRDTVWLTPAEVPGIECYCTLPVGIDPADYRPAEP